MSDDGYERWLTGIEEISGADGRAWPHAFPAALRAFESLRDDRR